MLSGAHLAEHLGEVPAIVIPVILGRHDSICLTQATAGKGVTPLTK